MSGERFDHVDETLRQIGAQLAKQDTRLREVGAQLARHDARFDRVDERIDTLDRHMHVLHEQAMSAIRGIAEHDLVARVELDRRLAETEDRVGRRVAPLEDAVRKLSRSRSSPR